MGAACPACASCSSVITARLLHAGWSRRAPPSGRGCNGAEPLAKLGPAQAGRDVERNCQGNFRVTSHGLPLTLFAKAVYHNPGANSIWKCRNRKKYWPKMRCFSHFQGEKFRLGFEPVMHAKNSNY